MGLVIRGNLTVQLSDILGIVSPDQEMFELVLTSNSNLQFQFCLEILEITINENSLKFVIFIDDIKMWTSTFICINIYTDLRHSAVQKYTHRSPFD